MPNVEDLRTTYKRAFHDTSTHIKKNHTKRERERERERERDGRVVIFMGTPISGHPGMGAHNALCPTKH